MKIGYPCINLSVQCKGNRTFRLKSYSEERLFETVNNNLECLLTQLQFNAAHNILFFRITSDLVPFASHPINKSGWQKVLQYRFRKLGEYIAQHTMRVSMHPDQFTLINSLDRKIFKRSVQELHYHAEVLDLLGTDMSAKIQIHIGGVYGNKQLSIKRFRERYKELDGAIKKRLVIENDERSYSLKDCMRVHEHIGIPVVFDVLHHEVNNNGEDIRSACSLFTATWNKNHGLPIVDFSNQKPKAKKGLHSQTINVRKFRHFLKETQPHDFDIMLEIKDKERSALKAIRIAAGDTRFSRVMYNEHSRTFPRQA